MPRQVYDIFCPNDRDKVCPAKAEQVKDFTGDPTGKTPLAEQDSYPERLLTLKLAERNIQGTRRNCEGPQHDECPVRAEVNADPVRRVVVDGLRSVVRFVRGSKTTA